MPQPTKTSTGKLRTRRWNPPAIPDLLGQRDMVPLILQVEGYGPLYLTSMGVASLTPGILGYGFVGGGFKVLLSVDVTPHGRLLHASISHQEGLPMWEVVTALKRAIFPPDVAAVMVLPEEENYVNIHPNCLHLYQLPEKWGLQ